MDFLIYPVIRDGIMFNMITLPDCEDVKQTLQELRFVYSSVYSLHFNKLIAEAKSLPLHEESYLYAWQGLAGSGLSAEQYFQRYAYALSVDEQEDVKAYLQTLQEQQRSLKEVNFIAIHNGNKIAGFIIYHILEMKNETIFQIRQSALSNELITQLVDVLMTNHPYAFFEANKANANTIPVLNALHKAQLAAAQATLLTYTSERPHYSTTHGMFRPSQQDPAYPTLSSAAETMYRPFINVR
jgi:hypothetical protein